MSKGAWNPSLEEAAVLWAIRTYRDAAAKAPLVAQTLTRWVAERNQPALKAAHQAFMAGTGQKARGRGRPPKVPEYTPKDVAAMRALLVWFLQSLPPASRKRLLRGRPSTAERGQGVLPQACKQIADAMLQGLLGIGSRTLKGLLAEGGKALRRSPGLSDLAREAGIQPDTWKPVWDYLVSLPPRDRLHVISNLQPPPF